MKNQFVLFMLTFVLTATSLEARDDFFVSKQGNDAWSGRLKEPNAEKTDGPFATFRRALDALREMRRTEPERKDRPCIFVRRGTYCLDETLLLTPEDSGTKDWPTEFRSWQVEDSDQCALSEKVVLSAGRPITGWKENAPGRWTVKIPEVAEGKWSFEQLYVNDQRRFRTALPKKGYFTIHRPIHPGNEKQHPDRFFFGDAPFRSDWKNLNDVEVQTFHLWTMDHLRVQEVDDVRKRVVFAGPTHSWDQAQLKRGTPYRIVNVQEALSEPGEWYLDRKTGELTYLAMPGEDMNTAVVIAPRLPRVVSVQGDLENDKFVEHVQFWGMTFAHTAWNMPEKGMGFPQAAVYLDGAVSFRAAKHCSLNFCALRHTGNYAVDFDEGCEHCAVYGCALFDLGGGGVKIGPTRLGHEANEKKWCSNIFVFENHIAHGGRLHPESVGVWIGHAGHNMIANNEVYDFYYSAVSVGWNWSASFSPAHHNVIRGNHLHRIGQGVLNDMAGIYTLGVSPGTVLSENVIHDVSRMDYGGWGIYFDADTHHIIAEHNLVYDTEDAGLHQHYGTDNIVRKNIFAFGRNGLIRLSNAEKSGKLTIEDNIFHCSTPDLAEAGYFDDKAEMKNNVYWRTSDPDKIVFPGDKTFAEWKERESAAVVTDPKFVDPDKRDFSEHAFFERKIGPTKNVAEIVSERLGKNRIKDLPPVPTAFEPTPKSDQMLETISVDESFEDFDAGERIPDFVVEAAKECSLAITDKTGAGESRKSLRFVEGPDAPNAWAPHLYLRTKYRRGTVLASFDLRVEKGAHVTFECRDWPGFRVGYGSGPIFEVRPDGRLFSLGKELLTVPPGEWFHVETSLDLNSKPETFKLAVTLKNQEPKTFELPCSKKMDGVDWIGLCSFGENGTVFYVDNLRIRNE